MRIEIAHKESVPAGDGMLERRVVVAKVGHATWATHIEAKVDGVWFTRFWGHYFTNVSDAMADYAARVVWQRSTPPEDRL